MAALGLTRWEGSRAAGTIISKATPYQMLVTFQALSKGLACNHPHGPAARVPAVVTSDSALVRNVPRVTWGR